MYAIVNGWKMWGEPAPSVALPPDLEAPVIETEPTVCGYAPHMPEAAADPAEPIRFAPVGSFDRVVESTPLPRPSPGTVVCSNPLIVDVEHEPDVEAEADAAGSAPLVPVPGPEIWTTTDSKARPFHWASIRPDLEPDFHFSGAAADQSQLTFIGALDLTPREPENHERRTEVLRSSSGWIVAVVGAVFLAGILAALFL